MSKVMIIGAGGVGSVVAHKCAMLPRVFSSITLASRTMEKCEKIRKSVQEKTGRSLTIAGLDADDPQRIIDLIRVIGNPT